MRQAALVLLALAACSDGAGIPATTAPPSATSPPVTTAPNTAATATVPLPTSTTATTVAATTSTAPATTSTQPVTTTTQPATTTVKQPPTEYVFPIAGPVDYGPDHHDYPATDIFAPAGATVYAVTSGVVDELSRIDIWDPGVNDPATRGGLYFSLIGDDGVRYYYSHFATLEPSITAGDRVAAGQVIGTVGTSGNARDTPPHIHFGLSLPTFPGDWEVRRGTFPPYDYLELWAAGVDATPPLAN